MYSKIDYLRKKNLRPVTSPDWCAAAVSTMFTDSEMEPYSNGEYFPSSDEETWDAFRTAVALLRMDPAHTAIKPPQHRGGYTIHSKLMKTAAH